MSQDQVQMSQDSVQMSQAEVQMSQILPMSHYQGQMNQVEVQMSQRVLTSQDLVEMIKGGDPMTHDGVQMSHIGAQDWVVMIEFFKMNKDEGQMSDDGV